MPARNVHHDAVRDALVADGGTITADPLALRIDDRDLFVDLAAERGPLAAGRGGERIGVEVQTFRGPSPVKLFQEALGQYQMYEAVLADQDPGRRLFLAVAGDVYDGILSERLGRVVLAHFPVRLRVFDPSRREVIRWIS